MISNIVTKWRQGKRISKAHLAREIKVCRAYVTRLEKGELQPSGDVMFRIARYFKCSVDDIFQLADKDARTGVVASLPKSHFPGEPPSKPGESTITAEINKHKKGKST
jgi:putative transcriptional regulator